MIDEKALLAAQRATTTAGQRGDLKSAPVPLHVLKAALEAYESAKPKDAEGLKLGSRLTVEGVEAVVVDVDLIERSQHQLAASPFPFDRCVGAEISAMLSAAGDGNG